MIVIFRVNKLQFLVFTLTITAAFSAAHALEENTYCFNKSVNLHEARASLGLLLLPKDTVEEDIPNNCLDIITSVDRGKLFEKYLSKRYALLRDAKSSDNLRTQCRLDLRTTKKMKSESMTFKIGEQNKFNNADTRGSNVSVTEILLGSGIPGEIEVGSEKLKVTCQLAGVDKANLIFSFSDKKNITASTQVQLKKEEWQNIASVVKDLNQQSKIIGIPETEITKSEENTEIVYELQFK